MPLETKAQPRIKGRNEAMWPFRDHIATAVDGGGIIGVMVARALAILEGRVGQSSHEVYQLAVGSSRGSITSAGIGARLSGAEMRRLYTAFSVGSDANPSYLAAYEARFRRGWDPAETTRIGLGTGRYPNTLRVPGCPANPEAGPDRRL
jgi:hypothetical protein